MIAVEGDMLPSEDHALAAFHPNTVETATPDNLQSDSLCLLREQPRCYINACSYAPPTPSVQRVTS